MWPTNGAAPGARPLTGDELPEFDEATASVPVRHQGEVLGLLTVMKPLNEPLSPVEEKLVTDLGGASREAAQPERTNRTELAPCDPPGEDAAARALE
jgi:GAF domain-containing protein